MQVEVIRVYSDTVENRVVSIGEKLEVTPERAAMLSGIGYVRELGTKEVEE